MPGSAAAETVVICKSHSLRSLRSGRRMWALPSTQGPHRGADLSRTAKSFCCSRACTKTTRKCLLLSSEENRLMPSSMLGLQLSGTCGSSCW